MKKETLSVRLSGGPMYALRNSFLFCTVSVNYELVYVDGKPAVELGFRVFCLNEFKVRGFIDLVLRIREMESF